VRQGRFTFRSLRMIEAAKTDICSHRDTFKHYWLIAGARFKHPKQINFDVLRILLCRTLESDSKLCVYVFGLALTVPDTLSVLDPASAGNCLATEIANKSECVLM
jgi:hypothetical protein